MDIIWMELLVNHAFQIVKYVMPLINVVLAQKDITLILQIMIAKLANNIVLYVINQTIKFALHVTWAIN